MNEELTADELLSILQGVESDSENVVENVGPEDDDSESSTDEVTVGQALHTVTVPQATSSTTGQQEQQTWSSESFTPILEPFNEFTSGLNINFMNGDCTQLDVFEHFLDRNLVTQIVDHINQFHNYFILRTPLSSHSRLQKWHNVTVPEFYIFIAVIMLMARNNHLTIEEHWSNDPLLLTPIFGNLMTRNRFCSILGMLHFNNPMQTNQNSILEKIELVTNHARDKYKALLTPYQNLCIDESIVPFKGRLNIKQYLPKKRNRFGIKLFVLCDVTTGIIIDFIVYCGATSAITDPASLGVGGAVVATLLKDFFGTQRHLYIDNWFTSPKLFRYLHDNKIYACGTVRKNRAGMPVMTQKLKKGELITKSNPPLTVIKWRDKKDIYMLTSIHNGRILPSLKEDRVTGLPVLKPEAVLDYSSYMGSVDTADMLLSSVQCIRKSLKWYKKLFFHVVDMHMLNAFFSYKIISNKSKSPIADFQLNVIRQIIQKYNPLALTHARIPCRIINNPIRVLPGSTVDHMPVNKGHYRRCKECAKQKIRKQTKFMCRICNVYLCVDPCFRHYHSK